MGMRGDMLKRIQEWADRLQRFYVTHTVDFLTFHSLNQ